jgi:acetyl-CoA carboxylase biotin carboxylase subunit
MEMNTRIQVEHPVTEEVIDCDLVEQQIRVALGEELPDTTYAPPNGHAIECRINAENPFRNFSPAPGQIDTFHLPGGHGVRVDTHAYAGYVIPPHYDSMIAKLIVRGDTRERAITKMQRALDEFVIEGIDTTVPFHQQLMRDERFRDGDFTTRFLDDFELVGG